MKARRDPFDPSERVVIPLVVRQGKLVPFYGGEMPKLKEGWVVDLITEVDAFQEEIEAERFNVEDTVVILEKGKKLYACLRDEGTRVEPGLKSYDVSIQPPLGSSAWLVPFELGEDLRLHLRGTRHAELLDCECKLPFATPKPVRSVNQAYTRLSEQFELERLTHGGNVFLKVYFEDTDGSFRPLSALRSRKEAELEKRLYAMSGELPLDTSGG